MKRAAAARTRKSSGPLVEAPAKTSTTTTSITSPTTSASTTASTTNATTTTKAPAPHLICGNSTPSPAEHRAKSSTYAVSSNARFIQWGKF